MTLPSCVIRTLEFEFGNYTSDQLDQRIKECCEGDVPLCNEYPTCYYLMHGMAVNNLELGLRHLSDTDMRRFEDRHPYLGSFEANIAWYPEPACIELGLRWLHDLSSRCTDCGAISERMVRIWPLKLECASRRRCGACIDAMGSRIDWSLYHMTKPNLWFNALELGLRWLHDRAAEPRLGEKP